MVTLPGTAQLLSLDTESITRWSSPDPVGGGIVNQIGTLIRENLNYDPSIKPRPANQKVTRITGGSLLDLFH
jgi:hypothetical protein